jgi:hypothetical protein
MTQAGWEQWVVDGASPLAQPSPQNGCCGGSERSGSLLSAFPPAPQVRACSEGDIATAQPDQLGHSKPGLDGHRKQGVVSAADPTRTVRAGEEGVDLWLGEKRDEGPVGALWWDGEHAGDEVSVLGVAEGCEAEQ